MRVGGDVVDGWDGVFLFFSCGGFAGDEAAGVALEGFFSVWLEEFEGVGGDKMDENR